MRKFVLSIMLAMFVGSVFVIFVQDSTGYVFINLGRTSLEMSFWTALVLYGLSLLTIYFILVFFLSVRSVFGLRLWFQKRRNLKGHCRTIQGLESYSLGLWNLASKKLLSSYEESFIPELNLQFAARAEAHAGQLDQAREILRRLKTNYPKSQNEADCILANLLLEVDQGEEALKILKNLQSSQGKSEQVLYELTKAYVLTSNWVGALETLKRLPPSKVISEENLRSLACQAHAGRLNDFSGNSKSSTGSNRKELDAVWDDTPKILRNEPKMLIPYASALDGFGDGEAAQRLLLKKLKTNWRDEVIECLGMLSYPLSEKNVAWLESRLVSNPENSHLLLALGRISRRSKKLVKSCDYLERAMILDPTPLIISEFAEVKGEMGDSATSAKLFRRGLHEALSRPFETRSFF